MPTRLLVASIGNPAPYLTTLHSAGHTLLGATVACLAYPSLMPSALSRTGLSSTGADYTFFQSGTMMNVSGPVIASAYKAFVRTVPVDDRADARLVVLHDELESPLGKIRVRVGGSAKGHNGLKSVMQALGGREFVRIGVGIGRPESRERGDVAEYVLRKMRREEIEVVRERAREVVRVLDRLREGREV